MTKKFKVRKKKCTRKIMPLHVIRRREFIETLDNETLNYAQKVMQAYISYKQVEKYYSGM